MRKFINIINEATKPTKTGDKIDLSFKPGIEQPLDKPSSGNKPQKPKPLNFQMDAKTKRAIGALGSPSNKFHDLEDVVSDEEARRHAGIGPDIPTTENLPAIINKEITKFNNRINPDWHQIKHLPGYLSRPIRALGRQVFSQFTDVPIEDIQMIGTIANINPERDVAGVMDWIRRNGIEDDKARIDFSEFIPGYDADVSLWRTKYYTFLLVKDIGGYYVYGWKGGRDVHVKGSNELKRLKSD